MISDPSSNNGDSLKNDLVCKECSKSPEDTLSISISFAFYCVQTFQDRTLVAITYIHCAKYRLKPHLKDAHPRTDLFCGGCFFPRKTFVFVFVLLVGLFSALFQADRSTPFRVPDSSAKDVYAHQPEPSPSPALSRQYSLLLLGYTRIWLVHLHQPAPFCQPDEYKPEVKKADQN